MKIFTIINNGKLKSIAWKYVLKNAKLNSNLI